MATNHSGHRNRVKKEFLSRGLEGWPAHRVLELLLFYAIPQGDVNALAHALIERFGSLSGVLDATVEDLKSVPGVGEHTAVLIKLMPAMGQAYVADRSGKGTLVLNRVDAAEILRPYFFGARNELIYILCMDSKGKLLGVRKVADGTIDAAEINTRRLVEEALSLRAAAIYVAHNHVSNLALPSSMDWITTDRLRDLLAGMGIILKDHLIFVDDDFVSIGASDPRYRNALFDIT